ncbi:malonate decarboxylase subunit epsilon [Rouxiella sp. S1S-2]|uniref:malonate decarboxylase subunit epsilon n=1 Tax=Rouxiella sp. S1S-2 TaxID=2653856 RepID=UPI001264DB05|nr:malonate decarboxylase subunit epsilon [Rouxiella sp. S1S-2]KAB7894932.1 malonate decarboxylase subunit epsilon [Rouxiella sp. S1S-2]
MKILFTFPGQGPQFPGMLHQLPKTPMTLDYLERASAALGQDVLTLDGAEALLSTRQVQLCLLVGGVIWAEHLRASGVLPDFVSGLSIGAFPAAVVCGALVFDDAVKLVALRGELMQQAYPQGFGLSAIVGLRQQQIEKLISQVNSPQMPVFLANINAEDQLVIAGSDEAMQKVRALAALQGAHKSHALAVSVPSHCSLLEKPAARLAEAISAVTFTRPDCGYLSGSSARVYWQPEKIADDLAFNMARRVNWFDAMVAAYQREVRLAVEMPPGSVLTGLTKRVMTEGVALSLSQSAVEEVNTLAQRLERR